MLRAVVSTFLSNLTEREFDAPLLALLASQGFTDVHLVHGGFEFGKDVIAKRVDEDGVLRQYAIQSKAGDIGASEWRAVRPQLEECEYNTRAHPGFDATLPRVAVLVTTGVLKGSAPVDSQEFRAACASRGLADFETWTHTTIVDWLCHNPSLGLTEARVQTDLLAVITAITDGTVTEPALERHSRLWLLGDDRAKAVNRAQIEAAILMHELRNAKRLDLAALVALELLRAGWEPNDTTSSAPTDAALRLFVATATELLDQAESLLGNPKQLAVTVMDFGHMFTYPAVCARLLETFSLLALVLPPGDERNRAETAVATLAGEHPGTTRPPSEQFAIGVLAATVVLAAKDPGTATVFLRRVSKWLLDCHDEDEDGLGLGAIDEDEHTQFERVVAGRTTLTSLEMRRSSYLACVVLDAVAVAGARDLYDAVRKNLDALRIVPTGSRADELYARWRRGGPNVYLQPRLDYSPWADRPASHPMPPATPLHAVLLASVTRTRHYVESFAEVLRERAAETTTAPDSIDDNLE